MAWVLRSQPAALRGLRRAGLPVLLAGWLRFSVTLGQVLDSALGSLSDRQDRCSKQQLPGYHLLNYYYTNHSYKALQNIGKQDLLCAPIHLYGWEEDQGPFKALEKFRKKNVSHKFSGDSEWHTDLTPPLGSGPPLQFGQFFFFFKPH